MGKKTSLRNFLRKEILKGRAALGAATRSEGATSAVFRSPAIKSLVASQDNSNPFGQTVNDVDIQNADIDSLFGEPITPVATREEVFQTRLENFLAERPAIQKDIKSNTKEAALFKLREQLVVIMTEKAGVRSQKQFRAIRDKKIGEIRRLEAEVKIEKEKALECKL